MELEVKLVGGFAIYEGSEGDILMWQVLDNILHISLAYMN